MATFTKKEFEKKDKIKELVDSEGGVISGDRNVSNNSEIETGPVQKAFNDNSDFEKGVSTTTDRASRYRQDIPYYAVYSGSNARRAMAENSKIITKKTVEEKIDDLVKRKFDNGLTDKNYNSKISQILDIINDNSFSDDQLADIAKAITDKKANPSKTNI